MPVELGQRLLAKIDRLVTTITFAEVRKSQLFPLIEIHPRGGKQVGITRPDGSTFVTRSEDIVHTLNKERELEQRFRAKNPPKPWIRLSDAEISAREKGRHLGIG